MTTKTAIEWSIYEIKIIKMNREEILNSKEYQDWKKHISKTRKEVSIKNFNNILRDMNTYNYKKAPQIEFHSMDGKYRITATYCQADLKPKVIQFWNNKADEVILNFEQEKLVYEYLRTYIKALHYGKV